jgi:hypothetical protein
VDVAIVYEDVIEQLEDLDHDSAAFFKSVFEDATTRRAVDDASVSLQTVAERVSELLDDVPLEPAKGQQKSLVWKSNHPDHHDAIGYNAYITEPGEGGWTKIRLKIRKDVETSVEQREAIKAVVEEHESALPDYEWKLGRKTDIGAKTIWHDDLDGDFGAQPYVDTIAEGLVNLVNELHRAFVDLRVEESVSTATDGRDSDS